MKTTDKQRSKEVCRMVDGWLRDIGLTALVAILSFAIVLPTQILICFKIKDIFVRLLPVLFFLVIALVGWALSCFISGWAAIGYLILACITGFMACICGVGWGVWFIIKLFSK